VRETGRGEGITFITADFLTCSWAEADVIFSCCVTFPADLIESMRVKAERETKVGTVFITVGQPFTATTHNTATTFRLMDKSMCDFSWASCLVYLYVKQEEGS